MGAFVLIKRHEIGGRRRLTDQIRGVICRQGFAEPEVIEHPQFHILLYRKLNFGSTNLYAKNSQEFVFSTGTFIYKEHIGSLALQLFFEDFNPQRIAWEEIYGHFCLCVSKGGRLHLLVDRLGIYKVYVDSQGSVYSSSFLAVLASLDSPMIATQALYEYVFQGATYGNRTVIEQIDTLDCNSVFRIGPTVAKISYNTGPRPGFRSGSFLDHLNRCLGNLRAYYKILANVFEDKIDTALSGGYDSRLTLALLFDQGVKPRVHVYGRDGDGDVRVAKQIARTEGFAISHVDKGAYPRVARDAFSSVVDSNFYAFDGCPTDGIFDNGSDLATRLERCANGELMLNGGGGEVFRNFFYLLNRRFSVEQLVWSFYSQYDPRVCASRFSEPVYQETLATKIKATLDREGDLLERNEIEFLYPCFRCRYWMGRNNSVNNRFGLALTPFIDFNIVRDAIAIPLEYKTFGTFEGRMIREISPRLARHMSVYGHGFSRNPPLRRKLHDLATLVRPPYVRRFQYRVRHRKNVEFPYFLRPEYIGTVVDPDFPYLSRFFILRNVLDPIQYARICTLEYQFQTFSCNIPR